MAGTTASMDARTATTEETKPRLSVAFRLAAEKDAPKLAKIFARAFSAHNEFNAPEQYMLNAIANPEVGLFVAEAEGKAAGLIMLNAESFKRGTLYVDQLAVDPDFQGYGIGRQLMKKAENVALAQDFKGVALHVRKDNDKAISLYKSLGYKTVGVDRWYYSDGTTAFEMVKSLRPDPANDNKGWGIGAFFKKIFNPAP